VLEPFPNAVRVHADNYELERHRNGATGTLVQQRVRPFAAPAAPRPELAAPFAEDAVAPDGGKRKRRKRELKGQLRSYKVRMIPAASPSTATSPARATTSSPPGRCTLQRRRRRRGASSGSGGARAAAAAQKVQK
jgi:hypothetical protein